MNTAFQTTIVAAPRQAARHGEQVHPPGQTVPAANALASKHVFRLFLFRFYAEIIIILTAVLFRRHRPALRSTGETHAQR
jgi:hypothetical protein